MINSERLLPARIEDQSRTEDLVWSELVEVESSIAPASDTVEGVDNTTEAYKIVKGIIQNNRRRARINFGVAAVISASAVTVNVLLDSQADYMLPELATTEDLLLLEQSNLNAEECIVVPSIIDGRQYSTSFDACLQLMGSTSPTNLGAEAENVLVTIYESGTDDKFSSTEIYQTFDNASGYADTSQLEFAFSELNEQGKLDGENYAPYIYLDGRGWLPIELYERQLIIQTSEAGSDTAPQTPYLNQQTMVPEINCNGGVGNVVYGPPAPTVPGNELTPTTVLDCSEPSTPALEYDQPPAPSTTISSGD